MEGRGGVGGGGNQLVGGGLDCRGGRGGDSTHILFFMYVQKYTILSSFYYTRRTT